MAPLNSYKTDFAAAGASESEVKLNMKDLVAGTNPDFVLGDRSYGKSGVKILHVVKNGELKLNFFSWEKIESNLDSL